MHFACCTWALSNDEQTILDQIAAVGFQWIDIQPAAFQEPSSRQYLQTLGLNISCMGLSFGLPEDVTFDSPDSQIVEQAMITAKSILDDSAARGIANAYVIPGLDDSPPALSRYGNVPGRALPTIATTLDFVRAINHPNLYLLLDIGHAQMSNEDIPSADRSLAMSTSMTMMA